MSKATTYLDPLVLVEQQAMARLLPIWTSQPPIVADQDNENSA